VWIADIHCDFHWVAARQGNLGDPRYTLTGGKSKSLDVAIELLFYGDDQALRHFRVLMHTDTKEVADRCVNLNVHLWANGLESTVMMATGKPFHLPMTDLGVVMVILHQGDRNALAPLVRPTTEPSTVDYQAIAHGMVAWGADLNPEAFYLRRMVDMSLPLDMRWLNGYRLLEWHFVRSAGDLSKSREWRAFLLRFEAQLRPLARPGQGLHGLIEEARAMAAHANMDKRSDAERESDPLTTMQKSFRALEDMVMTVLNEHPGTARLPVRFHRRDTPPSA
jgi:hypothetical protein